MFIVLLFLAISSLRIRGAEVTEAVVSAAGETTTAVSDENHKANDTTTTTISSTATIQLSPHDDKNPEILSNMTVEEPVSGNVLEEKVKIEPTIQQSGPFIDILGRNLLSLEMVDDKSAMLKSHNTTDALKGKKVIGLYFSADWCGPCRKFTPELVSFYEKINRKRGKQNQFEIVWISRCRDVNSYGQYFTHMGGWLALPPEEAMGKRGQLLGEAYKVKGIPHLVLLDEDGNIITTDARNKIPQDKAGIGFPWRNPLSTLYINLLPKSLRLLIKSQISLVTGTIIGKAKATLGLK
jgi:nucleoredoxin